MTARRDLLDESFRRPAHHHDALLCRIHHERPPFVGWPGAESNCRHADFQSAALPTELPGRTYAGEELSGPSDGVGVPERPVVSGETNPSAAQLPLGARRSNVQIGQLVL